MSRHLTHASSRRNSIDIYPVPCSVCGALAGDACTGVGGKALTTSYTHPERKTAIFKWRQLNHA